MFKYAYVALASAAMSVVVPAAADAQQAAITSGGNVTAEEVTPLPPVVVESPSQPITEKKSKGKVASPIAGTPAQQATAQAQQSGEGSGVPGVGIYTLGQLDLIGGSTITNEAMWTFNKNSVDQALSILPGVTMQNSGGSRNERDILVRGFDRFRVPLYMDGVRIYLPYDNRLDFDRFLTPDLSEIQVEKGYVSVLNGPGGEGGAINLVSRKPTKEVELEGRSGAVFDGDLGSMGQWNAYAYGGTKQKGYYAQVSGNIVDQDHFDLSNDFTPASPGTTLGYLANFPYEDGGNRDRSGFQDWRVNTKVGITPNATDEYSINYTNQQAEKQAPLSVDRQIVQGYFMGNNRRYWDWPQWDISTLSWLSKTQIGDKPYVKTNAYWNTFDNIVDFDRTATYTTRLQESPYRDHSVGGFVEMGTDLIPMNTLKGAVHFRRDFHWEQALDFDPQDNFTGYEPRKKLSEEDWSFAVENTFHATRQFDIVAGLGYDTNNVLRADGTKFPLPDLEKWNWQGAAIYRYSRDGSVHADVSSRTRFPTLFDRYSSRFGSRTEEPDLNAERATNYEVGWSDRLFKDVQLSSAIFYSKLQDNINTAYSGANGNGSLVVYNANGDYSGFEFTADWDVTRTLRIGGNYTYLQRTLDFADAALGVPAPVTPAQQAAVAASEVEGTPTHEVFLYAAWKATHQLTLTPSVEIASDRNVLVTSCASTLVAGMGAETAANGGCNKPAPSLLLPNYTKLGAYALLNFEAEYAFDPNTTVAVGGTNLLDQNYELADGFPEAGRMFFANIRSKF